MKKTANSGRAPKTVNERGRPIGEGHHFTKLTDEHIDAILDLCEAGLSYAEIARRFTGEPSVSRAHVRRICLGERRCQLPAW